MDVQCESLFFWIAFDTGCRQASMQVEAHPESKLYDYAYLGFKSQKESFILAQDTHSALTHVKDIHLFFRAFDNLYQCY